MGDKEIVIFFYPGFHRLQIYVKIRCLENILSLLKKLEKNTVFYPICVLLDRMNKSHYEDTEGNND